jgi:hypothetical protein
MALTVSRRDLAPTLDVPMVADAPKMVLATAHHYSGESNVSM